MDSRQEKIGFKIREAQLQKIPAMLVIGDREVETNQVALRTRRKGDRGAMSLEAVQDLMARAVKDHSQELP